MGRHKTNITPEGIYIWLNWGEITPALAKALSRNKGLELLGHSKTRSRLAGFASKGLSLSESAKRMGVTKSRAGQLYIRYCVRPACKPGRQEVVVGSDSILGLCKSWASLPEIAKTLGVSDGVVRRCLRQLVDSGCLDRMNKKNSILYRVSALVDGDVAQTRHDDA